MARREWRDDQIDLLRRMLGEGASYADVAKALGEGVTRNAVAGMAHRQSVKVNVKVRPKDWLSNVRAEASKRVMVRRAINVVHMPRPKPKPPKPPRKPRYKPVDIVALEAHHCRWPVDGSGVQKYCGKDRVGAGPYCADHSKVAGQPHHSHPRVPRSAWA